MNTKQKLARVIAEEFSLMLKEAEEKAPNIEKKLEELRKKFESDMPTFESQGDKEHRPEKRIQIKTVSEILDIPVNELVLYFMNEVKIKNERSLVEYHLGHVYFYPSL